MKEGLEGWLSGKGFTRITKHADFLRGKLKKGKTIKGSVVMIYSSLFHTKLKFSCYFLVVRKIKTDSQFSKVFWSDLPEEIPSRSIYSQKDSPGVCSFFSLLLLLVLGATLMLLRYPLSLSHYHKWEKQCACQHARQGVWRGRGREECTSQNDWAKVTESMWPNRRRKGKVYEPTDKGGLVVG